MTNKTKRNLLMGFLALSLALLVPLLACGIDPGACTWHRVTCYNPETGQIVPWQEEKGPCPITVISDPPWKCACDCMDSHR